MCPRDDNRAIPRLILDATNEGGVCLMRPTSCLLFVPSQPPLIPLL